MRDFKAYSIEQIKAVILALLPLNRKIDYIHIHHTGRPTKAEYQGLRSIQGIHDNHVNTKGWSDIGYHLIIDPVGAIWVGRDLNRDPASILNHNAGAIAVAMIGNFDTEILKVPQKKVVIELVRFLVSTFQLSANERILFHGEKSATACPGKNIKKAEFVSWVQEQPKEEVVHIRPIEIIRKGKIYNGHILKDRAYIEVRKLLEDIGEQVDWVNEQVIIEPVPLTPEGKLEKIRIIIE